LPADYGICRARLLPVSHQHRTTLNPPIPSSAQPQQDSLVARILVTSLFFLWGFALNLNPILIPHLKRACQLNDLQSAFIDAASYVAYFVMAIPAGFFIRRVGYKGGITFGLLIFAIGAFLILPAAETRIYAFFLLALFIIACGLTFLETAANPYITSLGDPESASRRLNLAQSFNGLSATLAPLVGGYFILSENSATNLEAAALNTQQFEAYLKSEAALVEMPFLVIGIVVLMVALLIWRTRLPEIVEKDEATAGKKSIWDEANLIRGVIAQFFYVGAQVSIASFFIRYSGFVAGISEQAAAFVLSAALFGFMAGRFFGTFLMKYIPAAKLLAIYTVINITLVSTAISTEGTVSVYCLAVTQFFMSIGFPTIFSLSIRGLGARTKQGSSLVIMSIVGGAIFPLIMGWISDRTNIQYAYGLPAACFLVVLYFAIRNIDVRESPLVTSH
jgi:FHS family L-fucose permease-like MFS transporter